MRNGEFPQSSVHPSVGAFCIPKVCLKKNRFLKSNDDPYYMHYTVTADLRMVTKNGMLIIEKKGRFYNTLGQRI